MSICENCRGKGLVSSGAVAHDLDSGAKNTCPECAGTGQAPESAGSEENSSQSEEGGQTQESPKDEGSSSEENGGGESGEQSAIVPKEGDACETVDGAPGVLQQGEEGLVCVASQ